MSGTACWTWSPFNKRNPLYRDVVAAEHEIYNMFLKSPSIKALKKAGDVDYNSIYKTLYFNTTGKDLLYGEQATPGEMRLLKQKVKRLDRNMLKDVNKFQEWIYLPQVIAERNPITAKHFRSLSIASNHHRGNQEMIQAGMSAIGRLLLKDMDVSGMQKLFPGDPLKTIGKKIAEKQNHYADLLAQEKVQEAKKYFREEIEPLSKDAETSVIMKAMNLFQNGNDLKKLAKTKWSDLELQNKYGANVVLAAKEWYTMRDKTWSELNHAMDNTIKSVESFRSEFREMDDLVVQLKTIKSNLVNQPDYIPRVVFDLFPMIESINNGLFAVGQSKIKSDMTRLEVYTQVKETARKIIDDVQVSKHVMERSVFADKRYSKDLLGVIDAYTKNIARWNFQSKATLEYIGTLRKLMSLENSDLSNQSRGLLNFLHDTHRAAMGQHKKDAKFTGIARAITSFEFMSKMFGLRAPTKNMTQSIQNINHFGAIKTMSMIKQISRDSDLSDIINSELKSHGFRYVNLEELAVGQHDIRSRTIKYDAESGLEYQNVNGFAERLNRTFERAAQISGKPMQWVENHVNRALTFRLGFTEHYNMLMNSKELVKMEVMKAEKTLTEAEFTGMSSKQIKEMGGDYGGYISQKVKTEIVKKSSRFAANVVEDLHYLYDAWAKPKYMRTNVGAVQGQFSVFRYNHFNMTMKRHINAKDELMALYPGEAFGRVFRTYATNMIITSLLAPMLGLDLGYLWQDDTLETVKNSAKFYSMEEGPERDQMREKLFFGKGPVLGMLGGPFFGDLIKMGQLFELVKMDEDNWFTYLAGFKDIESKTDKDWAYESTQLASNFVARAMHKYPEDYNSGGAFSVLLKEFGVMQSQTNLAKKAVIDNTFGIIPAELERLNNIERMDYLYSGTRTMGGRVGDPFKPKKTKQDAALANYKKKIAAGGDVDEALKVLTLIQSQIS